ncbi:MAG: hypothetical protein NW223_13980 [Hyphomicrobiaceae bacterium]|nr:hypothetical protein [Hyphomicrobiaceae bacterium]
MKVPVLLAAATMMIATTTVASAHDHPTDHRRAQIDARRAEEAARIRAGRYSGELTLTERWRLQAQQRHIAEMERNALRDGHINRREQHEINRALDRASRDIYREKHDGQVSWWRRW